MLCTYSIFHDWAHVLYNRKDVCPDLNYCSHIQIIIFQESLIKLLLQYCCVFKVRSKPDTVFFYICIYGAAIGSWIYLTDIYWALTCVRYSAQGSREVSQTYLIRRIIHNTYFSVHEARSKLTESDSLGNKSRTLFLPPGMWEAQSLKISIAQSLDFSNSRVGRMR